MSGCKKRWREAKQLVMEQFRLVTTTLLSSLLPLSFLLLSRLSSAALLLTSSSPPQKCASFFLNTHTAVVYAVVSVITVHTLIHSLITKIRTSTDTNRSISFYYPRVSIAWVVLLILQLSVGLGLQGTISKGVNVIVNGHNHNFLTRHLLFFGLHEVMLQWYRVIVKTVVESGFGRREEEEETVVERMALAVSCGTLWWWKLRDEIEALVGVTEVKRALLLLSIDVDFNSIVDLGTVDFVNWGLYYTIVTIGVVRIVKGCFWVAMILLFEQVRIRRGSSACDVNDDTNHGDDKV